MVVTVVRLTMITTSVAVLLVVDGAPVAKNIVVEHRLCVITTIRVIVTHAPRHVHVVHQRTMLLLVAHILTTLTKGVVRLPEVDMNRIRI